MYRIAEVIPSDISEHIPYLRKLASSVNHITEMGASIGHSTSAFLASHPKRMISYDLVKSQSIVNLQVACRTAGIEFVFYEKSVLDVEIEETDLLFIDTWHVEEQIREELKLHASKAKQFIVMHDTEAFAHHGEVLGHGGIWHPVAQYMKEHTEWQLLTHFKNNNGLTVFQRGRY
jgi:predicted O-methyltransferase YrrM